MGQPRRVWSKPTEPKEGTTLRAIHDALVGAPGTPVDLRPYKGAGGHVEQLRHRYGLLIGTTPDGYVFRGRER